MSQQRVAAILLRLCLGAVCLVSVGSVAAQAATVREGTGPCSIVLEGPIVKDDIEKLAAFKSGDGWLKDGSYWEPVLCLDSPGGSLVEGERIARFVHEEGIQTRVGEGRICHSVCAIIFMMGNKHSGPTSVEENRTLHIGGDLGFVGPSIRVDDDRSYGAGALEKAYRLGVESARVIVGLANSQRPFEAGAMMHPGLIEAILDTPVSGMLRIRTIEQALSWDIGLEGVPEHLPPVGTQRQMVCENGLSRGFRRPSDIYGRGGNNFMTEGVFRLEPLSGAAQYRLLAEYDAAEMAEGLVYSFRYWDLPVQCRVGIESGDVRVCGSDATYRRGIGDCEDDIFEPLPDYARYHPQTEFRALRDSGISADVLRAARCTFRMTEGSPQRTEHCFQAVDIFREADRKFARHTLHWQDGGQTRIEIGARPMPYSTDDVPDVYRVDGVTSAPHGDTGECLMTGTGSVICVTAR